MIAISAVEQLFVPWLVSVLVLLANASEFPDRECCDSIPPLPAQFSTPSVTSAMNATQAPGYIPSPASTTPGSVLNTATATINCKLTRQLCIEDQVCRSIADIVPRLCGQQLVSCSTNTVTKCQAALRTLVAFPFFQPTCLCKEPRLDPECNAYRNIVFDHPCFTVKKKDKDPYPIHSLPKCDYSMETCRRESHCSSLYDQYRELCKVHNNTCLMENSDQCYDAWTRLRLSPLFGCVCPDMNDVVCRGVFVTIHENTCIDWLISEHYTAARGRRHAHSQPAHLHRLLHPLLPVTALPHSYRSAPVTSLHAAPHSPVTVSMLPNTSTRVSVDSLHVPSGAQVESVARTFDHNPLRSAVIDENMHVPPQADAGWTQQTNMQSTLYGGVDSMNKWLGHDQHAELELDRLPDVVEPLVYQSSCHVARDRCLQTSSCGSQLQLVLAACHVSSCQRKLCMQRLRNFYSTVNKSLALEVAFCVCRRNPAGTDDCLSALQQLHPPCAQQVDSSSVLPSYLSASEGSSGSRGGTGVRGTTAPSCSWLVYNCRRRSADGGVCRHLLEQYEQACAVDAGSERCAGPRDDCRLAVMAILGTQLRTVCSCQGLADQRVQQECLSWRALLWNNPCVDEAQRQFHRDRMKYDLIPSTSAKTTTPSINYLPTRKPSLPTHFSFPATPSPVYTHTTQATTNTEIPLANPGRSVQPPATTVDVLQRADGGRHTVSPEPFCASRRHGRIDDHIPVGSGVRYYLQDQSADKYSEVRDCSELCMCHGREQLVCNVVECTPRADCHSPVAMYPHGAAGLLPYREGCVCYRGDFVCMRPPADQFTLPFGVFLFLGFSAKDETILFPYTRKTIKDNVVAEVMQLLATMMKNEDSSIENWPCTLDIYQYFELTENVILQAKIGAVEQTYNHTISPHMLLMEKEECSRPLREVSYMVNNRAADITSHPLLSIVKMADVVVFMPTSSAQQLHICTGTPLLLVLVLVVAVAARVEGLVVDAVTPSVLMTVL